MDVHIQIYEFASSAGALEGFLYRRNSTDIDVNTLSGWIANLSEAYGLLAAEDRRRIQPGIDQTLGRAVRSLEQALSGDHPFIRTMRSMIAGDLPASPDDFRKVKWFQKHGGPVNST